MEKHSKEEGKRIHTGGGKQNQGVKAGKSGLRSLGNHGGYEHLQVGGGEGNIKMT